ncbi:MAG: hypothetical protein FWD94_00860 [Treponema sp.]|nr:hypothetical protein [Treponema sp.]
MKKRVFVLAACLVLFVQYGRAEEFKALVSGILPLSVEAPEGASMWMAAGSSVLIQLQGDTRFLRGLEVRVSAPEAWFAHQGGIALTAFADLDRVPTTGVNDLAGRRIVSEPLPAKIQSVFQIPMRQAHGLETGPYSTVPAAILPPESFPALLALLLGSGDEPANLSFLVSVRPILGEEGAVRFTVRYPERLRGRPFSVLVNNVAIGNPADELLLRAGEHHLAVVSESYRNESRRFVVERSKTVEIVIELQDPTPLIVFEAPQNAQIFLNNSPVFRGSNPVPVEPGVHEARFQIGDYVLTRTITVQRGRTYRISLAIDIDVDESE